MGNGSEALKAVADYVTDTVDNDGVPEAVENSLICKIRRVLCTE